MTESRRPKFVEDPTADELSPDLQDTPATLWTQNGTPPLEDGPDPFDPERLRLPADYTAALGVKKALLVLPVRKPAKEWFCRVHPDPRYHLDTKFIELKEAGELYLVDPAIRDLLEGESTLTQQKLFLAVNRQGTYFFWPVRLPGPDGRMSGWTKSALEAAQLAMHTWVRVVANQSLGAYNVWQAEFPLMDPEWPDMEMKEFLRIAFKDNHITTWEHSVLRQLRGEV